MPFRKLLRRRKQAPKFSSPPLAASTEVLEYSPRLGASCEKIAIPGSIRRIEAREHKVTNFVQKALSRSNPQCPTCGALQGETVLVVLDRFWLQSATYHEHLDSATFCWWCKILRSGLELCVEQPERTAGYLDWGKDPYVPVWYGRDQSLSIEIFCAQGKFARRDFEKVRRSMLNCHRTRIPAYFRFLACKGVN